MSYEAYKWFHDKIVDLHINANQTASPRQLAVYSIIATDILIGEDKHPSEWYKLTEKERQQAVLNTSHSDDFVTADNIANFQTI